MNKGKNKNSGTSKEPQIKMNIEGTEVEQTTPFKYLRTEINNQGNYEIKNKWRITQLKERYKESIYIHNHLKTDFEFWMRGLVI